MPLLPNDTLDSEYREMCKKLFEDIEDRRNHFIKLEESQKQKYIILRNFFLCGLD